MQDGSVRLLELLENREIVGFGGALVLSSELLRCACPASSGGKENAKSSVAGLC